MGRNSILKSKLLSQSSKLGDKSKQLLVFFADNSNCFESPQDAFNQAAIETGLNGTDSLVLSSRLKCGSIIKDALISMGENGNIDELDPRLMKDEGD